MLGGRAQTSMPRSTDARPSAYPSLSTPVVDICIDLAASAKPWLEQGPAGAVTIVQLWQRTLVQFQDFTKRGARQQVARQQVATSAAGRKLGSGEL